MGNGEPTTSGFYVREAKRLLDVDATAATPYPGRMIDRAHTLATLAVAAELHDLNTHLRGAGNGVAATTREN